MITIPEVSVAELVKPTTISELYVLYKMSDGYTNLAPKSKVDYNYYANALLNSVYSQRTPEYITPQIAQAIYKSTKESHKVWFANAFVRLWSVVYTYAQSQDWILYNPWSLVKTEKPPTRDMVWTQEMVYSLCKLAIDDSAEGVCLAKAIMLLYETGQRPSDVLRMTSDELEHDDNGWFIKMRQKKTDNMVMPAITHETADLVEWGELIRVGPTVAIGSSAVEYPHFLIGISWTPQELQYQYRKYRKMAGLSDKLQMRDLRRTALTEAGAGGATDDQMKAHSGHTSRDMLDTYSVSSRIKALEAHRARFKK